MPAIPSWAQSSADPTQVSLTVTSLGKSLAGLVVVVATVKGVDPSVASASWSAFVAQAATFGASAYTAFQAAEAVYGLFRKAFYRFTSATPSVGTTVTVASAPVQS